MGIIRKIGIVISVVVIFALSTEFLVRKRMNLVDVVVAKHQLGQRQQITKEDLTTIKTSRHLISEDAFLSKDDIIGQYVKMEHTVLKNQVIHKDNVENLSEAIDAPQLLLYENQRVFALKKDVVGSAGASIQRGSFVDVAVQNKKEDDYGVILEKVRVVGVKNRNGIEVSAGEVPHVILLAVDNENINALLKHDEEGKLVLLPRDLSHES